MKKIFDENKGFMQILGMQKFDNTKKYRKLAFLVEEYASDNNLLLYNNLTKAACVLDPKEAKDFNSMNLDNSVVDQLFKTWFFVPQDFDEVKVFNQIKAILSVYSNKNVIQGRFKHYNILTTTNCNARCFYCYEHGCEKIDMDESRCDDVINFIKSKAPDNKKVTLSWFGGEPTFNYKAIDYICENLTNDGFEIRSTMISNGYIFDEDIIKRAVDLWKLKNVQITLDGTEDVYNKTKNYKVLESNESPFQRVLRNIELLCENSVFVNIRLNLSKQNEEDIEDLVEYLGKRFEKTKKLKDKNGRNFLGAYCHTIFQELHEGQEDGNRALLDKCYDREDAVQNRIAELGYGHSNIINRSIRITACMADNPETCVILPDGKLTSCEHFMECLPSWGSIYSDKYNQETLTEWKKLLPDSEECRTCEYYPNCVRLANCPEVIKECNSSYRNWKVSNLHRILQSTYTEFLKQNNKLDKVSEDVHMVQSD